MTILIDDVAPRAHYVATHGQTEFAVPFEWINDADLKVWVNEILCTFDAPPLDAMHYSTTGQNTEGGGSISFGAPGRLGGDEVIIIRDMSIDSPADFPTNGVFPVAWLNAAFDEMTAGIQQAEVNVQQRTLRQADNDFVHPLKPIPMKYERAGKVLGFDIDGQPICYEVGAGGGDGGSGGSNHAHIWTGDEPPPPPWHDGDLWWESDTGKLFVYYDDGNSNQWVETGNAGGASGLTKVVDRASLKLMPITSAAVYLIQPRHEGIFRWYDGNYSVPVAKDTREGIYVASSLVPATLGCWVRPDVEELDPWWFGAIGNGVVDDKLPVQASWIMGAYLKTPVNMYGRLYNCSESIFTDSNLTVFGNQCVMYITAWPEIGGFVNNVWTYDPDGGGTAGAYARRVQHNVVLDGIIMDGSKLPPPVPVPGGPYQNTNLHDWGWGMYDATVRNCEFRYIRYGYGEDKMRGGGGSGMGGEQGLHDCVFENNYVHHCHRGVRLSGNDFVHAGNGEPKSCTGITIRNTRIEECGCAIIVHSTADGGIINSHDDTRVVDIDIDGVHAKNCGHQPWRDWDFVTYAIPPEKTGIIVLAGGENIRINNVQCINDSDYTTKADWLGQTGYPATGDYIGRGLSGPIGAVIWGYGRNIKIENVSFYGNADNMYYAGLANTFGEIGSLPIGSNEQLEAFNFEVDGYRQPMGSVARWLNGTGTIVAAGVSMRFLNINSDVAPSIEPVAAGMANVTIGIETVRGTGIVTRGTTLQWRNTGWVYGSETIGFNLLGGITLGGGPSITVNATTPEGNVVAVKGSLCMDTGNGKVWVKATGTGNTGWVVAGTQS